MISVHRKEAISQAKKKLQGELFEKGHYKQEF